MSNENKNQERPSLDREWWEIFLGIYRDERIDQINLSAAKIAFILAVVGLLATSGAAAYFGQWEGWAVLALLLAAILFMVVQNRRLATGYYDERAEKLLNQQYVYWTTGFIALALIIAVFGDTMPVGEEYWMMTIILPIFYHMAMQIRHRAYPNQTWILAAIMAVAGGIYGYQLGAGNIPPVWAWTFGIGYTLLLIAIMIYRYRKWGK